MKYNVLIAIKKCEYFVLNKEEKVPKLLSERDLIRHFLLIADLLIVLFWPMVFQIN